MSLGGGGSGSGQASFGLVCEVPDHFEPNDTQGAPKVVPYTTGGLFTDGYYVSATIQPASVRAVCYQLFTRGLIDSMAKTNTNRVSTQLVWAREHGYVAWDWIVDETREPEYAATWDNPDQLIKNTIDQRTAKEKGSGSVPDSPVPFRATISNGASAQMPK